jgi:hypothetical protein
MSKPIGMQHQSFEPVVFPIVTLAMLQGKNRCVTLKLV